MDNESRLIVGLDVADCREVERVSQRLERTIILRGLTHFVQDPLINLTEVVSDASRTVISLLSKFTFFSALQNKVSYCDHSLYIIVHPTVNCQ